MVKKKYVDILFKSVFDSMTKRERETLTKFLVKLLTVHFTYVEVKDTIERAGLVKKPSNKARKGGKDGRV